MKKKHLIWIVPTSMIIGIILFFIVVLNLPDNSKSQSPYDWNSEIPEMSHYWTCMDGCYFMEEIIFGNLSYENETQEKYHSDCSKICWEQLIENGGNYTR